MAKELMSSAMVIFDAEANSAEEVINLIADSMDKDDRLIDRDGYVKDVLAREEMVLEKDWIVLSRIRL